MKRKDTAARLRLQSSFEDLLTGISAGLVNLAAEEVSGKIRTALESIGRFLGNDTLAILERNSDREGFELDEIIGDGTFGACARSHPIEELPFLDSALKSGKPFRWTRGKRTDNPLSDLELNMLGKCRISSMYVIPVPITSRYAQCLLFMHGEKGENRTGPFVDRLILLGHFIGNVLKHRESESALVASEKKYKTLFRNMAQGVFYQQADGTLTEVNNAALRMFGITKDQFLGRTSMHPEWRIVDHSGKELPGDRHPSMIALKTGKRLRNRIVGVFNPKKGALVWLSVNANPQFHPGEDKPYRVFVTLHDLTSVKKAEEELRQRKEFIETVLDNIPVGLSVNLIDSGEATYLNPVFEKIYGWPRSDIRNVETFFQKVYPDPEYREQVISRVMKDVRSGDPERMSWEEIRVTGKDGTERIVNARNLPLYDQNLMISTVQDVTKRVYAEKQIHETMESFQNVLNLNPSGMFIYRYEEPGRLILVDGNPAAGQLTGKTVDQFIGMEFNEIWPAARETGLTGAYLDVIRTGKSFQTDEITYEDNVLKGAFRIRAYQIPGRRLVVAFENVTDRKQAELALKLSEARYKDLVERSGVAVVVDDREGKITYFNTDFAGLFGYSAGEMKNLHRSDLFHKADNERIDQYHRNRIKGRKAPERYEVRGVKKDGQAVWLEVRTSILKDQHRFAGTRNYIWDISERKQAEAALAESEFRFRELFTRMNSGVIILNEDQGGNLVVNDLNRAAEMLLGISRSGVAGRSISESIPLLNDSGLLTRMKTVGVKGEPDFFPVTRFREKKLLKYLEVHIFRLLNGELVVVFDDFTERIISELELHKNHLEIRKLSRHIEEIREEERKEIARNLHDDLGQILTAIQMDIGWIRNKVPSGATRIAERADNTLKVLSRAIDGIRKISSELRPPLLDNLGLFEALQSLTADLQDRCGLIIDASFPPSGEKLDEGFSISVYRMVQEGLTNAIRHSGASKLILNIMEKSHILVVELSDNGNGIPEEKIESTDSLGLIGIKERVLRWNGEFSIQGEGGKGTLLRIKLPLPE